MSRTSGSNYRRNQFASVWRPGISSQEDRALLRGFDSQRGQAKSEPVDLAASAATCGPFEWVALGYLAVSSALIVVFAANLAHPLRLLSVQVLVALLIVALCRAEANVWTPTSTSAIERLGASRNGSPTLTQRFWHFSRHWYPHLFFLFCFEELGALVHLVSPRWQDAKLIAFDHWLTGVHPVIWLEQFVTPARNEFMQFAYLTYFVYLLALGGILYYREDWRVADAETGRDLWLRMESRQHRVAGPSVIRTLFYRLGRRSTGMIACATWAMRRRRSTSVTAPISWRPTGRSAAVKPQGTEIAGMPAKFAGRFRRSSRARV